MSLNRDDMLRELELLPMWQLRTPLAKPLEVHETAPTVSADAEPETIREAIVADVVTPALEPSMQVHETPTNTELKELVSSEPSVSKAPTRMHRIELLGWDALQADVQGCESCGLAATRTQTVFGVGDPNADWLIVGEAPGAEEDRKGEPFVGQAGKLLDNMLAAIQLKRGNNVYIANVLKCRPPENRDPHGEEVTQCDPYLKRQVELIQPKLIIALGKFVAQSLLNTDATIASLRGRLHDYNGVPVIVTYHPAYLLRNLPDKAKAWEDLCYARETMQQLVDKT